MAAWYDPETGVALTYPHDLAGLRVAAESPTVSPAVRVAAQRVLQDAEAAHEHNARVEARIARLKARSAGAPPIVATLALNSS